MENIKLSHTAKALVNRIYRSKKHKLPRFKANLVRLRKEQIKGREPPSPEQREVVWWYYNKREFGIR